MTVDAQIYLRMIFCHGYEGCPVIGARVEVGTLFITHTIKN